MSRIFKDNLDEWKFAPIFKYEGKYVCINELPTNKFIKMPLLDLKSYYYKSKFLDIARAILLQVFYNITLDEENGEIKLNEKKEDIEQEEISKSVFPPTFFVQYRNGTILKKYNCPLNNDHAFSKWLINNSNYLHSNYNEYFNKIIRILIDDSTSLRAKKLNRILERIMQMDQNNYLKNIPNIKDDDFRYYAKS